MDNERQRRFRWIYATGAVVLVVVTIVAVAFAVQEHNDRVLSEELTETASELQDTGARIANIRDAGRLRPSLLGDRASIGYLRSTFAEDHGPLRRGPGTG
jgi:hypothetical protein